MPTSYPGAIDSYSTKIDGVSDVLAADINNLQDAVVAVQTRVGTTASSAALVTLAGSQTISGTKTFSASPLLGQAQVPIPDGNAPFYGARAHVNFNGAGTVSIRSSGNVSSITDLGAGYYRINFTTALPNANYAVAASIGFGGSSATKNFYLFGNPANGAREAPTTSGFILAMSQLGASGTDVDDVCAVVFR